MNLRLYSFSDRSKTATCEVKYPVYQILSTFEGNPLINDPKSVAPFPTGANIEKMTGWLAGCYWRQ